ncbi:Uncharacterised protein [Vibrio cholerae]|nr:Uncharacterised protein [Vibrio cholerae]
MYYKNYRRSREACPFEDNHQRLAQAFPDYL